MPIYAPIFEAFREAHAPFIVIGGHAVVLHGHQRNTFDLDLLISESYLTAAKVVIGNARLCPLLRIRSLLATNTAPRSPSFGHHDRRRHHFRTIESVYRIPCPRRGEHPNPRSQTVDCNEIARSESRLAIEPRERLGRYRGCNQSNKPEY